MDFDDGQHLYGKGNYLKLKGKLILDSFKLVRTLYRFIDGKRIIDNSVNDTSTTGNITFYEKNGYLLMYDNNKKKLDYSNKFLLIKFNKKAQRVTAKTKCCFDRNAPNIRFRPGWPDSPSRSFYWDWSNDQQIAYQQRLW